MPPAKVTPPQSPLERGSPGCRRPQSTGCPQPGGAPGPPGTSGVNYSLLPVSFPPSVLLKTQMPSNFRCMKVNMRDNAMGVS